MIRKYPHAIPSPWQLSAAVGMLCLLVSCREGPRQGERPPQATGLRENIEHVTRAQQELAVPAGLPTLIDSLKRVPGAFAGSAGRWRFSGTSDVFNSIAEHEDSAVVALVDCLDRADSATATVAGRRVLVGVMCFAALQRMAYPTEHEDADESSWPGIVAPTASAQQLKAAKREWLRVVREKRYRIA